MSAIKRYDMFSDYDRFFGMEQAEEGGYVSYDDHAAALAAKEAELAKARKLNEFWRDQAASFEAQLMGANKELAKAWEAGRKLNDFLIDHPECVVDIPDEIYVPFVEALK